MSECLSKLARRQLLRARHRVLAQRTGHDVPIGSDERSAICAQVLAGQPLAEVAATFGVTMRRLRAITRGVWADLMPGKPYPSDRDRVCERCGATYTPERKSRPQRYCSLACANSVRTGILRVTDDAERRKLQEPRHAVNPEWGGPEDLRGAYRGATGRPGASEAKPESLAQDESEAGEELPVVR